MNFQMKIFTKSSINGTQIHHLLVAVQMEEASSNPASQRCAVVTGANKGIGLEISRQLASKGITVILTARDEKKGIEAISNLKNSGLSNVVFHQLDVKDSASIASLAKFIETQFGKLDILVNNAGDPGVIFDVEGFRSAQPTANDFINPQDQVLKFIQQTYEKAEECLRTNYYGLKEVTESIIPLLKLSNSANIVNVSSIMGQLKRIPGEKVTEEFKDLDGLTEDKINNFLQKFLKDFKQDKLEINGWPSFGCAYIVSKVAVNAYTRILAKQFPGLCINCVHPGFVKTDITCNMGILTAEEGARGPVMLALLPAGSPSGLYYDQMEISTFD